MEMTGEKEDALESLRAALTARLREKGLSKEDKKLIRAQLVELTKAPKSRRPEHKAEPPKETTPRERARRDAIDLRDRARFIAERQGAYKAAWIKFYGQDGSAVAKLMGDVVEHVNAATGIADAVLSSDTPSDELIRKMEAVVVDVNSTVLPALQQVDALLRAEEAASGTQETIGDPMQVLAAMQSSCDATEWAKAAKFAKNGKVVYGPSAVLDKVTKLIGRYVETWSSIKGDGNDEVPHSVLTALNKLRMEIVQTIAESGDVMLMACCAPGTEFHTFVKQLASQSCRSHDVQVFAGWWAKSTRTTD